MLVNLHVYEVQATWANRAYFVAESEQLPMQTNCKELKNELAEFFGDSKDEVIAQAKTYAKHLYGTGRIKLI
jgi:hypothetical protein